MRSRRPMQPGKKLGERHGRLPVHGESRFPKQRDPLYVGWIKCLPCTVESVVMKYTRSELATLGIQPCGTRPERYGVECAHVLTQGAGNPDRGNCIPLCAAHHDEQEGRTKQFCQRYVVDLYQIAAKLDAMYVAETSAR